MYEVVGIARQTEDESLMVLYRPLYESIWMPPADYQVRPLEMFVGEVEVGGVRLPRFTLITEPELISQLEKVRDEKYPVQI
jgi:hypothetical protein